MQEDQAGKEVMIRDQIIGRGVDDPQVLHAIRAVDRTLFVPEELRQEAYEDRPLPIGHGQTISQPYIVAYMAQALRLNEGDRVLEIGTGCGYNAAVLAQIAREVYSVEIVEWLAELAHRNLQDAGVENVKSRFGDGNKGWPEKAPFDGIVLTASPAKVPEALKQQLKVGGHMVAPVGTTQQKLIRIKREAEDHFTERTLMMVRFVPMTGKVRK